MDWRSWTHGRLTDVAAVDLHALIPAANIFGAGSLEGSPAVKPFIMQRFGPKVRRIPEGPYSRTVSIWVHDVPGDYLRIESALGLIRPLLEGQVAEAGAISCEWAGDSGDLADDGYGTITRYTSFTLVGNG